MEQPCSVAKPKGLKMGMSLLVRVTNVKSHETHSKERLGNKAIT